MKFLCRSTAIGCPPCACELKAERNSSQKLSKYKNFCFSYTLVLIWLFHKILVFFFLEALGLKFCVNGLVLVEENRLWCLNIEPFGK